VSANLSQRTLSVRGDRFSIQLWEGGAGQPTLYLHDEILPPVAYPWQAELANDRRIIVPQHPGFGRSTGLEHLDDIVDLAIYYLDFLDALGIEQVDLVGASFGGMIAAEIAALAPRSVRCLALVAPLGLWLDDPPVADLAGLTVAEAHQLSWADPQGAAAQSFSLEHLSSDDERRRVWIERTRSLAAAGKFTWPLPDKGLRKRAHRIQSPTLLIWGAEDRITPPAYAQAFQALLPGARLVTIPATGHFPLHEQSGDTLRELGRFLGNGV
jgi:pimeloyl-ACP methyl ester carboxylesterase